MSRVPQNTVPSIGTLTTKPSNELRNCAYSSYECSQTCLEGYSYCRKHILKDSKAPYKQCGFVFSGRKCQNPAPKLDKRRVSYCQEHMRKAQQARNKSTSKKPISDSAEALLLNLSHYVKPTDSNAEDTEDEEVKTLDPFTEISVSRVNAGVSDILECASSSNRDVKSIIATGTVNRGSFLDDSDDECLHSLQDDPLKHAGVFTEEEVVRIAREKSIRLQSLYVEQFKRLQYILKEKRRTYLHASKKEKETLCSIHDQAKETAEEKKTYETLKALNSYHRRSGAEAILHKKSVDQQIESTEGSSQKVPSILKCIFTEGGVKCGEKTLPAARHCRKHILKDQDQVLFKACGAVQADMTCHEPVPVVLDWNCIFHRSLPAPLKLEPMPFEQETHSMSDAESMDIDVVGEPQEIDSDDDIAGLMREMNDVSRQISTLNESLNSEGSTDTASGLIAQISDRDDITSL